MKTYSTSSMPNDPEEALAVLKPVIRLTERMVNAAHQAVRLDEHWAVNSRRDFRKGVRAMILAAMGG
jgi:hypothetical protein